MRALYIFFACGLAGCATQKPSTIDPTVETAEPLPARAPASAIVTRYELGAYQYPRTTRPRENAIYRRTRIAAAQDASAQANESIAYSGTSYNPLPPSDELAAELAVQRQVTAELRAIKDAMVAMERQAQIQYAALLAHTEETEKVRKHLEVERARVRDLEAELRERLYTPSPPTVAIPAPASTSIEGIKW